MVSNAMPNGPSAAAGESEGGPDRSTPERGVRRMDILRLQQTKGQVSRS